MQLGEDESSPASVRCAEEAGGGSLARDRRGLGE